ncbi:hypothetical protein AB0F96_25565 [Streptomyces sp. NPDC023998]|uniref:hypothetical protein n=1 Tax=Streptomyces sp. NPDC023998 TaxID=3154597 RepID=UPI0033E490B9
MTSAPLAVGAVRPIPLFVTSAAAHGHRPRGRGGLSDAADTADRSGRRPPA